MVLGFQFPRYPLDGKFQMLRISPTSENSKQTLNPNVRALTIRIGIWAPL